MNTKKCLPHGIVIAASGIASLLIFIYLITPSGPFFWDENAHALHGLFICKNLKNQDLMGFLFDTYRQVYWPPLFSWLSGIFFLIFEPSYAAARSVSLMAFAVLVYVVFLAARQLNSQNKGFTGFFSSLFLMGSVPFIIYSSQAMLEVPGILAIYATFLTLFLLSDHSDSPRYYMILGLMLCITYFTKTHFSILLILSILISHLMDVRWRVFELLNKKNLYTAIPMILIFGVWFLYIKKIEITWEALVNVPTGDAGAGFLFYPKAMIDFSGSIVLFCLYLSSFLFMAIRFRHHSKVRLLVIFVGLQLLIGQIHHTKDARHIMPIFPALFILADYFLTQLLAYAGRHWQTGLKWGIRFGVIVLIAHALLIDKSTLEPPAAYIDHGILDHVDLQMRRFDQPLVLGTVDIGRPNPPMLDWELITRKKCLAPFQAGSMMPVEEMRRLSHSLRAACLPAWLAGPLLPVLERSDQPNQPRSLYLGLPPNTVYSKNVDDFEHFFRQTLIRSHHDGIVVVASTSSSAEYPIAFMSPVILKSGFVQASTRKFENPDIIVATYRHSG